MLDKFIEFKTIPSSILSAVAFYFQMRRLEVLEFTFLQVIDNCSRKYFAVTLGRLYIAMSQQLLHRCYLRSQVNQQGCVRMAGGVEREMLTEFCKSCYACKIFIYRRIQFQIEKELSLFLYLYNISAAFPLKSKYNGMLTSVPVLTVLNFSQSFPFSRIMLLAERCVKSEYLSPV